MKLLRTIILLLALVGAGSAHAQAPPFPPNPTVGEEVTGPDGQIYVWDGVKWARKIPGPWAPETKTSVTAPANPTAGQLWFDPITLQTYIWYTDPTSSQWVAIVNGAGGGGGGGGGPFLPLTGGTLTGNLGIGAPATTYSLEITENHNDETALAVFNTDAGNGASSNLWLNNGPDWVGLSLTGTGYVTPREGMLWTDAANGLRIQSDNGPIDFNIGVTTIAKASAAGVNVTGNVVGTIDNNGQGGIFINNTNAGVSAQTMLRLTNDVGIVSYLIQEGSNTNFNDASQVPNSLVLYSANDIALASHGANQQVSMFSSQTQTAYFKGQAEVFPNTNYSQIQFGPYENPTGSILGHGNYGYMGMTGGGWYRGDGWIATAGSASAVTAASGNVSISVTHGLTPGAFYGPHNIAIFQHDGAGLSGLALGGWGAGVNGNGGLPALNFGQAYLGSETWANTDICSSCYFNGQWLATGGAGGGANLFQTLGNGIFTFYGAGAMSAGQVVPWNREASIDPAGLKAVHIENDQYYGVPTCSGNCYGFANGSRDTDGYIQTSLGGISWPATIHFARPFTGTVACTGNSLVSGAATQQNSGIIVFEANSPWSINIRCTLPNGTPCSTSGPQWISYHCMGMGG